MTRYAVLLRGVNVGGRGKLAMADLRAALVEAGFADVETYLQSGNAVLSSRASAATVARRAQAALAAALGACPDLLVRSGAELATIVESNPFPAAVSEPTLLNVAFLSMAPKLNPALDAAALAPDEFAFGDRCVYLRFVGTSPGRSRFGEIVCREATRGRAGAFATVRNWNTVLALAARTCG